MDYWLHRISHYAHVSYPLLEHGYLSIGFSDFSEDEFLNKLLVTDMDKEEKWKYFNECFQEKWGTIRRTRYNLWRFLMEFKIEDTIILPKYKEFSVYRVIGQPLLSGQLPKEIKEKEFIIRGNGQKILFNDEIVDIGFLIPIKEEHKEISRYKYADAKLTSRMKIRQTNANISDLKESIDKSIQSFIENKPLLLYGEVIDSISETLLGEIRTYLDPDKFEKLIEWYFKKIEASKVEIPSKNESKKTEGADGDIVATFENIKVIVLVQAKYHKDETNEWAVEQICKYKEDKLESGDEEYTYINWAITSGDNFTKEARALAKDKNIRLINGKDFAEMLIQVGLLGVDDAFLE